MMAPRRSEAATQKPKKALPKSGGIMQLILVGVGVVVLIVVAVLLFGSGGKKTAAPRTNMAAADTGSTYGKPVRKAPTVAAHKARPSRDSLIAKRREERLQRAQEVKAGGGRTTRNASGGYSSGGSTQLAGSPNQLRAILTDNSGARTALVGERRLKSGDDLNGRRIVDVSGDGIKVQYQENTYTVRVGEKVY